MQGSVGSMLVLQLGLWALLWAKPYQAGNTAPAGRDVPYTRGVPGTGNKRRESFGTQMFQLLKIHTILQLLHYLIQQFRALFLEHLCLTTAPLALYIQPHFTTYSHHGTAIADCYHIIQALDKRHHTTLSDDGQTLQIISSFISRLICKKIESYDIHHTNVTLLLPLPL